MPGARMLSEGVKHAECSSWGCGIACMLSLLAPAAIAEDQLEADFDYDAAIEDIPIKSDV